MSTPSGTSFIVDVGDADFEREVIERSLEVPVVVDFWAEWCGPCRVLGPTLEKLAREGNGKWVLAKMNVDQWPRHAQAFGVRGIPTVIAFRKGQIAAEFTGALPEAAVRDFLARLTPSDADLAFERAESLRDRDAAGAESAYRQALALEPGHTGASIGLAELLLARGENEEARRLVDSVAAAGALGERAEQVRSELRIRELRPEASESELRAKIENSPRSATLLMDLGKLLASEKRYPEALDTLFRAAESDPELARGEVKDLMVEIFHAVGVRSPLADEYRTKLSRLLY